MTVKILSNHSESTAALVQQTQTCQSATWAIAWATPNKVFETALTNIGKFRRLVVGTHGCHTHPECIEKLGPLPQVAIRRSGRNLPLFHPKLYLFEHSEHFTVVIGSHNLTKGAFENNVELSTLTQFSKDDPAVLRLLSFVHEESHASLCVPYSPAFLMRYQDLYALTRKQRRDLESLVIDVPSFGTETRRREAPIYMTWDEFFDKASHDQAGNLKGRLKVLKYIRKLFVENPNFVDMKPDDHLRIAGLASAKMCAEDEIDWNLFGSMSIGDAFGKPYGDLIKMQPDAVSKALAHIPLGRPVTKDDWKAYWEALKASLPDEGKGLGRAGATRLVCMKRPDYFVSVNNRSATKLAMQLDVSKGELADVEKYWDTVIVPMMMTPWWTKDCPIASEQADVWDFRAALLDVLVKEN